MPENTINCRNCQSTETAFSFLAPDTHGRHVIDATPRFPVHRCGRCGAYFLCGPEPDEAYYRKHYPQTYHTDPSGASAVSRLVAPLMRASFRSKTRALLRFAKRHKGPLRLLDIGCGDGAFLENLDPRIFEREGLERHPEACRICRDKGLTIIASDLDAAPLSGSSYDIVTLWHVLEHLPRPDAALARVRGLLKAGGLLALSVPNTAGLGFRWGATHWFHLDAPRHLTWFNARSLRILLKRQDFTVVKTMHLCYEYPLDLFWSLRASAGRFLVYPLYPVFKCLSRDILIVLARKN
ncbi:MAG: class I SAM-dependent methyltransferase [Deltaproteobacteria bacterium]